MKKPRPQPIYDFAIGSLNHYPRASAQIARAASLHFRREITHGSVNRALKRAQEAGIAERLDDMTWVQPEEWAAEQRRRADPKTIRATRILPKTTRSSPTGHLPALKKTARRG